MVLLGSPGAGKSSLVLASARRGLEVISDEIVPIRIYGGAARCPGSNPHIRVDPALITRDERALEEPTTDGKCLLDVRDMGLRCVTRQSGIHAFVFLDPRHSRGKPWRIKQLGSAEALTRLLDNLYTRRVLSHAERRKHFKLLARAARLTPSYTLSVRTGVGNLDSASGALERLLAPEAAPKGKAGERASTR